MYNNSLTKSISTQWPCAGPEHISMSKSMNFLGTAKAFGPINPHLLMYTLKVLF